ncbi:MAG: hypothetical protein CL677_09385 [Bdellovibrionaceae bacterium]|nr:hypothetical protein [Pseudobdellovibrionaceae bacterium]|tara:strand:+ start:12500 stop:13960 length:1461 start_codon:yes stop_codon:yes gene_type:complete
MERSIIRVLLILGLVFSSVSSFSTTIVQGGTGERDGLSVWFKGSEFYTDQSPSCDYENRYKNVYINVLDSISGEQISRLYCYHLNLSNSGEYQVLSFDLKKFKLDKPFMSHGLKFVIVNAFKETWSSQFLVEWVRNKVVYKNLLDHTPNSMKGPISLEQVEQNTFWNPGSLAFFSRGFEEQHPLAHPYTEIWGLNDKYLVVKTPAYTFGNLWNPSGAGFVYSSLFCDSPPCIESNNDFKTTDNKGYEELYLSYRINFNSCDTRFYNGKKREFDFSRGAKIPGLAGGHQGIASGGGMRVFDSEQGKHIYIKPNGMNGWSGRSMISWHGDHWVDPNNRTPANLPQYGRFFSYLYHPDASINDSETSPTYGDGKFWRDKNGNVIKVERDRWYHIQIRYKMNTLAGSSWRDGIFQVKLDGELVLDIQDMRYRLKEKLSESVLKNAYNMEKVLDIDTLAFNSFHGGGDSTYSPINDSCMIFDDIYVYQPHQ